jgi:uncharacterized protein YdhG (YjbR/CyaY superfamily)
MSRHNETEPQTIDEYITMQPEAFQPRLHELRTIIKSIAPQAKELISYQVPAFKLHYMLVGFGINKRFCSLYPMSTSINQKMADELKGIKISGTTLHFAPDQPLPIDLIKKIVLTRMQENEIKALSKKK